MKQLRQQSTAQIRSNSNTITSPIKLSYNTGLSTVHFNELRSRDIRTQGES